MGEILAAIPAYNEEKTIGSVVLEALRHVDEVAVVDDGSTDQTGWIARQAGATVIRHETNLGYGAALRSCFKYARENGTRVLVVLDGDGQHRPEAVPRVLEPVLGGLADISIGSRFLSARSKSKVPRYRRFGIAVLTYLTNLGTKRPHKVRDAQSGFRAYSRAALDLIDPRETGMGASAEILWEADKHGLSIVEVPVEIDYDEGDEARRSMRHGLSVIRSMVRYVETEHPLSVFGIPGVGLFGIGIVVGIDVINRYYSTAPPRELALGHSIITILFMIGGMMLSFTGLILHAVINANRRMR